MPTTPGSRSANIFVSSPVTVCVRPSDVLVLPPAIKKGRRRQDASADTVEAYVTARHFLGERELVELYLPASEIKLKAKLPFGALGAVATGSQQPVRIAIDADKALLFEE